MKPAVRSRHCDSVLFDELLGKGFENVIVLALFDRFDFLVTLLVFSLLLLLEDLPPLAESLGCSSGDFSRDFLPFVAVLGLEMDDEALLLLREGSFLDSGLEIVFPPFQTRFSVPVKGFVHAHGNEVPISRAILVHVSA